MSIARWSLKNPAVVFLAMAAFAAWGLYDFFGMSRREDPEIKVAMALVITIYPGAGADKVELEVSRKLEEAIESMSDLKTVTSTSRPNLSVVFVQVEYDADTDSAWQKLRGRVAEAKDELPSSVIGPTIWDTFGDTTGMIVSFTGEDPVELKKLAEDLRAELRSVASVGARTSRGPGSGRTGWPRRCRRRTCASRAAPSKPPATSTGWSPPASTRRPRRSRTRSSTSPPRPDNRSTCGICSRCGGP
jgi:multidrug efflux pump subunit AcrB